MKSETMTAWEILKERAETQRDPIAFACWKLVQYGKATEAQAVAVALEHYANEADRLRDEVLRFMEKYSTPMSFLLKK
jgi:hypothetical protein